MFLEVPESIFHVIDEFFHAVDFSVRGKGMSGREQQEVFMFFSGLQMKMESEWSSNADDRGTEAAK